MSKLKSRLAAWPLYAVLLIIPTMIILAIVFSHNAQEVADEYVAHVRRGELDEAYGMLAPSVRAKIPRGTFEDALSTSELRTATEPWWNHTSSGSGRACLDGWVEVGDTRRGLLVYLRDDGDGYQVEMVYVYTGVRPTQPYRCVTH